MKAKQIILFSAVALISATSCHKDKTTTTPVDTTPPTSSQVIADFATHVAAADYNDMYNNAVTFQTAEASFYAAPNDNDLNTMRTAWKGMRAAYEQGEGFLIGPIATQDLDPDVDTWPVEQNELDSILNSSTTLNASYVASLQSTLRGFHPVEYLIFGISGAATAADFTVTTTTPTGPRKKEYLHALTGDMVNLVSQIKTSYVAGSSNDFISIIENPSTTNTTYQSHRAVLLELVSAMAGICDEVGVHDPNNPGDGKINSVYTSQDPTLQESYFSNNSWNDFRNNILSIRNVYMNTYNGSASGHSLHELVAAKNLSLDNAITGKLNATINLFNNVTVPFGQAVQTNGQRTQVLNVMNAITDLKSVLDDGTTNNNADLTDFINVYVTD